MLIVTVVLDCCCFINTACLPGLCCARPSRCGVNKVLFRILVGSTSCGVMEILPGFHTLDFYSAKIYEIQTLESVMGIASGM